MENKALKILITLIVITTMIGFDIIALGNNVILALYEELEEQNDSTNLESVKFDVYFQKEEENTHSKQVLVDNQENLIINVTVKDYGIVEEAKIIIENANFEIDKDNVDFENIEEINEETNEIQLKQLVAGTVQIIIPIKFEKQDAKTSDYFDKETYVKLSGKYKNNDTDAKDLESSKTIRVMWTADDDVNIGQEIEKYINLGENGILLQQKVSVNVENGLLPVEKTSMKVKVPEIEGNMPNSFAVLYNGVKLDEAKYQLDDTNKILEINQEADNDEINWGAEEYKIIYIYPKEIGYVERNIEYGIDANIKLYTKEQVEKSDVQQQEIVSKGNVVTAYKDITENIYKGYMYANVEKQVNYSEILNLEFSNTSVLENEIVLTEENNFIDVNNEKYYTNQAITYKTIKVNKEKIIEILGEDGSIQIQNQEGSLLSVLDKDTDIYTFEDTINYAKIVISKPIKEGIINLNIDKAIDGQTGYSKEELKQFVALEDKTNIIDDIEQLSVAKNIELKDTNSGMKLEINKSDLTALEKNTDVEIRVTLLTNNETQELYKNPKIEIQFPTEIENVEVKQINLLHEEDMVLTSAGIRETEQGKKIEIQAQGEQHTYKSELQNTIISIVADIDVTNPESNIQEKIKASVTNNETLVETEIGVNICTVQEEIIEAQETQIDVNLMATVGEDSLSEGDIVKEGEVLKYKLEITNKEDIDLENLQIKFTVPENTKIVTPYEGEDGYEYTGDIYYEEKDDTEILETIEKIEKGQTIIKEYEVRISQDTENKEIESMAEVIYGEKTITSNTWKNKIENSDLRVSVKQTTDRDNEFQEQDMISYYIIVENLSEQEQNNIVVHPYIPENTSINEIIIKEYLDEEEIEEEYIEIPSNGQVILDSIKANGTKVVEITISIDTIEGEQEIPVRATAKSDTQSVVRSNVYISKAKEFDIGFKMTVDNGNSIKENDEFTYTIEITNNTEWDFEHVTLNDEIPEILNILSIEKNGEIIEDVNQNIEEVFSLDQGEQIVYKINVKVRNYMEIEEDEIINIATLVVEDKEFTAEIIHEFDRGEESKNTDTDKDTDSDKDNKEYYISGNVWIDEDEDGRRDNEEVIVEGTKVFLIDISTGKIAKDKDEKEMITTTNSVGHYTFENLSNGQYIVIFEYDNSLYKLTQYQKEGVSELYNSDVISQEMNINNEKKVYAVTDTLQISDNNVSNIDMGLLRAQVFNLSLEKTVTKITLKDSKQSKAYEYQNTNLAKIEIDAKKIDKTDITIEYQFKIKNTGDMSGYIGKLVDVIPQGLKFESSLNPSWYESNGKLYNKEVENQKINPEQEKIITLVLTKSMSSEDTGIVSNIAELQECYGRDGIQENGSKEDNKSQADTILTIKTGWITYIGLIILTVAILGVGIYFIIKKVLI